MLPEYLAKAKPNPKGNRGPWYANTAPTYAGIFLWVAFYNDLAGGTLRLGSLSVCLLAVVIAGLLCYALYYRAPAMFGMRTGYPLYVVGSSTFGTKGGYLMPGILMGLLQIGWFAVATFVATTFILNGVGSTAGPGSVPFILIGLAWGLSLSFVGAKGIGYVAKIATYLNFIPLVMLLIVLLTMLRFFVVVPWRGQETAQQNVLRQIQTSHVAPVLEEVAAPVWGVLAQWFPSAVSAGP